MKSSNKSSIITGIVLLALSAIFSISLILQPLDFGVGGPGHNNFFYLLGNMIFTVYGFSSILIPVFLFISGISCFATKWTAKRTMRLLTAVIPFFTAVITEKLCRSVLALGKSDFTALKMIIAIVTGVMLMVIEILGAGLIADKVNEHIYAKGLIKKDENNVQEEKSETQNNKSTVFDEALDELSKEPENPVVEEVPFEPQTITEPEIQNPVEPEPQQTFDDSIMPFEDADKADETKTETPAAEEEKNPSSIITLDEYAALTNFDDSSISEEVPVEDELEWPNLPKAPDTLPPEYTDEISEDDPALEFPPKEPTDEELKAFEDSIFEAAENHSNEKDENPENEFESQEPVEEETIEIPEFESETDTTEEDFTETETPEENVSEEESPYSTAKYLDTVIENPAYPHKIVIREGEEEPEEEEKKTEKTVKPSPYSSKISLSDNVTEEIEEPDFSAEEDELDAEISNFEDFNAQTEEETPEFEVSDDSDNSVQPESESPEFSEITEEEPEQNLEPTLDKNFFDIDLNDDEAVEKAENDESESPMDFSSGISDVFSEMEADIRKNAPKPIKPAAVQTNVQTKEDEDFSDSESEIEPVTSEKDSIPGEVTLQPQTATNLTADDLTDFFNAQSKENEPVTKQIVGNGPKTNRATKKGPYVIPSDLLTAYKDDQYWIIDQQTKDAAMNLTKTLSEFGIEAQIIGIKKGPVVTMFEILPAAGVRLSKIVALQDNIALALAAQSVRIVAPIPGKQAVGIEVPNRHRSIVGFREIIEMDLPEWKKMAVPVILGKDILGKAQLIDLVKTPHMLIAGATGSGKSVCVNSLILSILYKRSYKDVKLILVDPKVVELKLYNNIPHLLTPVITEPKKALQALQYCLCEMERRYALLDSMGVRDISNYNAKIKEQKIATEKLPYIVVIIDEFADLMATSGRELESTVARLTAMSRAVGIHLVLATQRPSVNVITGLIKANIPSRIAFMVSSRTDSNIIIDSVGAEKLLGRGDMLYASATDPAPVRIQGTFVSDQEVEDVVRAVKEYGEPDYIDDEIFVESDEDTAKDLFGNPMDDEDPLYDQALEIVVQAGKASASYLQRRLSIGYNRAARLVEEMEERGIVGPANGSKPREIIHMP